MKLISTTLTASSEDTIGDALSSVVEWVDLCLVIDTGATDETIDVARRIAGPKLVLRKFKWIDDFAAARNFALDAARDAGGDWAVTVDTDERIDLHGLDIRDALESSPVAVLLIEDDRREYAKDRFFRLPATRKWVGPVHEMYPAGRLGSRVLAEAVFSELPKPSEVSLKKILRDVDVLETYIKQHPHEPRWHFYLGESFLHLTRHQEAIRAYEACIELRGWGEEGAWACFRMAHCHVALKQYRRAVETCALGLSRHPCIAELPWLAAYCEYQLGRYDFAISWAELSSSLGLYRGNTPRVPRVAFRYLPGLYEGPYDVLRFAFRAVGHEEAAAEAEEHYKAALEARCALTPPHDMRVETRTECKATP